MKDSIVSIDPTLRDGRGCGEMTLKGPKNVTRYLDAPCDRSLVTAMQSDVLRNEAKIYQRETSLTDDETVAVVGEPEVVECFVGAKSLHVGQAIRLRFSFGPQLFGLGEALDFGRRHAEIAPVPLPSDARGEQTLGHAVFLDDSESKGNSFEDARTEDTVPVRA